MENKEKVVTEDKAKKSSSTQSLESEQEDSVSVASLSEKISTPSPKIDTPDDIPNGVIKEVDDEYTPSSCMSEGHLRKSSTITISQV